MTAGKALGGTAVTEGEIDGRIVGGVVEAVVTNEREEAAEIEGLLGSSPEFPELDTIRRKPRALIP